MMPYIISALFAFALIGSTYVWAASVASPPLMHGTSYQLGSSVAGYLVSEKFDGVRAYWDGQRLFTRQGNAINAPRWWLQALPNTPLDGELWLGYERFDEVSVLVRSFDSQAPVWNEVQYLVFDLPASQAPFIERYDELKSLLSVVDSHWVQVVPQRQFSSSVELDLFFDQVIGFGGEGLMLHKADGVYQDKRVHSLLKYKPVQDAEAVVIGYTPGNGKYEGLVGALIVQLEGGRTLRLGTGLSDELRASPPKIGSVVTFEYSGYTSTGLPRFARFKRERVVF